MADNPTNAYYTGDGVTTDRVVPCPYLSPSHIKVTIDGVAAAYSFVSSSIIRISPAPSVGKTIRVYRETPKTPIVSWEDGAIILGRNMNAANLQNIYIAEEAYSYAEGIAEEAKQFALEGLSDEVDEALNAARVALADDLDGQVDAANAAVVAAQGKVNDAAAQVALALAEKEAAAAAKADAEAAKDAAIAARNGIESAVGDANTLLSGFIRYYLGAKAVEPVVDNSGEALEAGALFFHTGPAKMKVWDGFAWQLAYNSYEAPPASTASDVANDSGVTGATVKDALNTLHSGKANTSHTHAQSDVTGLDTALAAKADVAALAGKADAAHTHAQSDVTGLDTALAGKQNTIGYTPANKAGDTFSGNIGIARPAGNVRDLVFLSGAERRWFLRCDDIAETGSNAGSDFQLRPIADGGSLLPTVLSISRATSVLSFGLTPYVGGSKIWHEGNDGAGSGLDADKWKGASFTVSTSAPSGGVDGDFWFERVA